MDKLVCIINGDNTAKVMSVVRKAMRKQAKTNAWFVIFSAVMLYDIWGLHIANNAMADEIMVLKSEVKKLQQQIGD